MNRLFSNFSKSCGLSCFLKVMIYKKGFTVPCLKDKLQLRVFLAGHTVVMVTHCVTKMITTCSPVNGYFFDTMIVTSSDKEWL